MQRGEGAKEKQQSGKYGCWEYFAIISGAISVLGVVSLVSCLICGAIALWFLDRPEWPEDFCTVNDGLYQVLAANGREWAAELAQRVSNYTMIVDTEGGQLWLYGDEGGLGFFVRIVYAPRFTLGKAGYFYARTDELPTYAFGPEDELTHLGGNVYCYIFDDPG